MATEPEAVNFCLDRCRIYNTELFRYRMAASDWRYMLLHELDRPTVRGHIRQLVGKSLGVGVIEVTMRPLKSDDTDDENPQTLGDA